MTPRVFLSLLVFTCLALNSCGSNANVQGVKWISTEALSGVMTDSGVSSSQVNSSDYPNETTEMPSRKGMPTEGWRTHDYGSEVAALVVAVFLGLGLTSILAILIWDAARNGRYDVLNMVSLV